MIDPPLLPTLDDQAPHPQLRGCGPARRRPRSAGHHHPTDADQPRRPAIAAVRSGTCQQPGVRQGVDQRKHAVRGSDEVEAQLPEETGAIGAIKPPWMIGRLLGLVRVARMHVDEVYVPTLDVEPDPGSPGQFVLPAVVGFAGVGHRR